MQINSMPLALEDEHILDVVLLTTDYDNDDEKEDSTKSLKVDLRKYNSVYDWGFEVIDKSLQSVASLKLNHIVLVTSDLRVYYIDKRMKNDIATERAAQAMMKIVKYIDGQDEIAVKKINPEYLEYEDFGAVSLGSDKQKSKTK